MGLKCSCSRGDESDGAESDVDTIPDSSSDSAESASPPYMPLGQMGQDEPASDMEATVALAKEAGNNGNGERMELAIPKDMWGLSWFFATKQHETQQAHCNQCAPCRNFSSAICIIFLLITLQGSCCFAIRKSLQNQKTSQLAGLLDTYGNIKDIMGQAGFAQLSSSETQQICGDFGDNYDLKDTINPVGETVPGGYFSYRKMPVGDWDKISDMSPGDRSVLDEGYVGLRPYCWLSMMTLVCSFLWWTALIQEGFDITHFAFIVIYSAAYLSGRIIGWLILVVRTLIWGALAYSGSFLLVRTFTLLDLVLNSLGLTFVITIDELFYAAIVTKATKKKLEDESIRTKIPKRIGGVTVRGANLLITLLCLVVAMICSLYMRWTQIMQSSKLFHFALTMCLFFGPKPDISSAFDGAYPVPGFCESLLVPPEVLKKAATDKKQAKEGLSCSLPGYWQGSQCLMSTPQTKEQHCRVYQHYLNMSEEDYCTGQDNVRVSSMKYALCDVDKYCQYLPKFMLPMQDPLHNARKACVLMWQKQPGIEFVKTSLWTPSFTGGGIGVADAIKSILAQKPSPPNSSFPSTNPAGSEHAAFHRMRDYDTTDRFAGPFVCNWRHILKDVLDPLPDDDELPGELARLWHNGTLPAKLESCGNQTKAIAAIRQSSTGNSNNYCVGHYQCQDGFCNKKNLCDPKGCAACTHCSLGIDKTCGAVCEIVQPTKGMDCVVQSLYASRPSRERHAIANGDKWESTPPSWQIQLDNITHEWFWFNTVTNVSQFARPQSFNYSLPRTWPCPNNQGFEVVPAIPCPFTGSLAWVYADRAPSCETDSINVGSFCEADGGCGTNNDLNNCKGKQGTTGGYDIYIKKVKCARQIYIKCMELPIDVHVSGKPPGKKHKLSCYLNDMGLAGDTDASLQDSYKGGKLYVSSLSQGTLSLRPQLKGLYNKTGLIHAGRDVYKNHRNMTLCFAEKLGLWSLFGPNTNCTDESSVLFKLTTMKSPIYLGQDCPVGDFIAKDAKKKDKDAGHIRAVPANTADTNFSCQGTWHKDSAGGLCNLAKKLPLVKDYFSETAVPAVRSNETILESCRLAMRFHPDCLGNAISITPAPVPNSRCPPGTPSRSLDPLCATNHDLLCYCEVTSCAAANITNHSKFERWVFTPPGKSHCTEHSWKKNSINLICSKASMFDPGTGNGPVTAMRSFTGPMNDAELYPSSKLVNSPFRSPVDMNFDHNVTLTDCFLNVEANPDCTGSQIISVGDPSSLRGCWCTKKRCLSLIKP